jgi:hypothetical protein
MTAAPPLETGGRVAASHPGHADHGPQVKGSLLGVTRRADRSSQR